MAGRANDAFAHGLSPRRRLTDAGPRNDDGGAGRGRFPRVSISSITTLSTSNGSTSPAFGLPVSEVVLPLVWTFLAGLALHLLRDGLFGDIRVAYLSFSHTAPDGTVTQRGLAH